MKVPCPFGRPSSQIPSYSRRLDPSIDHLPLPLGSFFSVGPIYTSFAMSFPYAILFHFGVPVFESLPFGCQTPLRKSTNGTFSSRSYVRPRRSNSRTVFCAKCCCSQFMDSVEINVVK